MVAFQPGRDIDQQRESRRMAFGKAVIGKALDLGKTALGDILRLAARQHAVDEFVLMRADGAHAPERGQRPAQVVGLSIGQAQLLSDVLRHRLVQAGEHGARGVVQRVVEIKHPVGDVIEGTVKNVTDFGAFIDLGGVDGLLHISEMSWGRVDNPKKVFTVGETLKVLVKDIHDTKVALSLKFPETNPWANAAEKYAVGTVVTGKVARMTDFGAFVELAPGVDALLHVSQISRAHVEKPSDVLSVGQEITAKIVDLNEADKKISLSMKALENTEAQEETEE